MSITFESMAVECKKEIEKAKNDYSCCGNCAKYQIADKCAYYRIDLPASNVCMRHEFDRKDHAARFANTIINDEGTILWGAKTFSYEEADA